jgi:hypothetical protein
VKAATLAGRQNLGGIMHTTTALGGTIACDREGEGSHA